MRLPARLHRNRHGVFGFRFVLPRRLRGTRSRREFRLTLGTKDPAIARVFAQHLGGVLQRRLALVHRMSDDDRNRDVFALIHDIASEREKVWAEMLRLAYYGAETDEQGDLLEDPLTKAIETHLWLQEMQSKPVETLDDRTSNEIQEKSRWLAGMRERLLPVAIELLQREDVVNDRTSQLRDRFHRLGFSIEHQRVLKQHEDKFDDRAKAMERIVEAAVRAATQSGAAAPPPPSGEPLSGVLKAYRGSQIAEGAWTAKSEAEIMAGLQLWLRIVGDQPITRYGHEQHRRYKATLQQLPPNLNKLPRYDGLSIDDVIKFGDPPAALNTVSKQLSRVSALFAWAMGHGYTEKNPAAGMRIKNPRRASDERDQFSTDDLRKLFGSPEYREGRHRESYMFWTPLIALYTGARQTEIAQLHLADFGHREGIPVIDINDQGEGKRVKTKASKRTLPVHSELVRLGLLVRVAYLRDRGETRLFPELRERRDGYGQTVSKWFGRYRRRCGVTGPRKVFHSFRHTVINALKQAGYRKEQIAELVGHEDDSVTMGRYGKAFDIATMKAVVDALQFADLTHHIVPFQSTR